MTKYEVRYSCYDKIFVNVTAYVIPVYVYVWCGVNKNRLFIYLLRTKHTHLTRNYIYSHIYQDFIITTHYYVVFYHFNNS
jgi:hypothetical protein